jgi:hypothetical protein
MSALPVLSAAAARVYDNINAATSPDVLDNIARAVGHQYSKGSFTDHEATFLIGAVDRRRPIPFDRPSRALGAYKPIGTLLPRIGSKFAPRPCRKRLSDEERTEHRHRKRMLGGSSVLPDTMRHYYTEGERAVLCIVAGEVKRHGICELPIDEMPTALAWAGRRCRTPCTKPAGLDTSRSPSARNRARRTFRTWSRSRPLNGTPGLSAYRPQRA